jgi:plasmid maintenance system antidote protein VapI
VTPGRRLDPRLPVTRIADIVAERRAVTTDTVLRLARYFKITLEFWLPSLRKDADPDIPILKQAKAEYAKLR